MYGDIVVKDENEVKQNWEKIKLNEGKKSLLSGVPNGLPALVKAIRLQEKTAQVGFEWKDKMDVFVKIKEELNELEEAISLMPNNTSESQYNSKIEEEIGDLMFSIINLSRYFNIDAETALERTNKKFKHRFEYIETNASNNISDMTLTELEELWQESKRKGL